jgi:hypothetical protein
MNEVEEKLWNYIDGSCTDEEQKSISALIDTDEAYQLKYHELLQLNTEFSAIELDEPSMAFTYNVMEAIRTETAQKPLKAAINKRIIWGVGAFFILSITVLLILVMASINWQAIGQSSVQAPVQFQMPPLQDYINGNVMRGFVFCDIVLGLFVVDAYLRKKLNSKQAE